MGILIPITIIFVYGFLGYKLGKNYILWGLMGLGIVVAPPLLALLFMSIFNSPALVGILWQSGIMLSLVLSVAIAAIIAYKNNAVFKKQS